MYFLTLKELGVTIGIAYFSFSIYLFYMLLGYWVRQSKIKIPKVLSILGFIGTGLYFVILAYVSDVKDYKIPEIFYSHSSMVVVLQSVLIFSLIGNIKISVDRRLHKIILFNADYSFGMYIMHMFWINILYKVFMIKSCKIWYMDFYTNIYSCNNIDICNCFHNEKNTYYKKVYLN